MAETVADVMRREYPAVDKDETLEHAVRVMEKHDLDRVLAFEKKKLVGIMTKRDIMVKLATLRTRSLVPGRLHVSSFMTPNPLTVEPSVSVVEAAKTMLEKDIGSLPVVEGDEVVGLVTRWEVAQLARELYDVRVVDIMTTSPVVLRTSHRVLHARQVIQQYGLLFVPVLDDEGRPVGYVTVDEIADALLAFHDIVPERFRKERIEHLLVDDIMRLRPPVLSPDDTLPRAVEAIASKRSKGAIVVHEGRIVGVVTLVELMKAVVLRKG